MSHTTFNVIIEGNIGCGKSTFINYCEKLDDVCVYTEPIDKWQNLNGVNILVR